LEAIKATLFYKPGYTNGLLFKGRIILVNVFKTSRNNFCKLGNKILFALAFIQNLPTQFLPCGSFYNKKNDVINSYRGNFIKLQLRFGPGSL